MPFEIVRNDIVKMEVDAIVNSANPRIYIGEGVDKAIHEAAGPGLFLARKFIGSISVGQAVTSDAFNLKAKYVIHTVGPEWTGGHNNEIEDVKRCYRNSLQQALDHECHSIAFPLISTGTYGFPKDVALQIAISVISEFVLLYDMDVYLVVYDKASYQLSEKLVNHIKEFIDDRYIEEFEVDQFHQITRLRTPFTGSIRYSLDYKEETQDTEKVSSALLSIDDLMDGLSESFSQMLLRLIDEEGVSDVDVYKKANIDRRLFSKIRSNKNYKPSKITVIAFAIALELNLEETKRFLSAAGFTLTHSSKFDIIIEFFIKEKNYNVFEINEVLFEFEQDLLGV